MPDLKTILGPEGYAEFMAALAQGKAATSTVPAWQTQAKAEMLRFMNWFGAALLLLPDLAPALLPQIEPMLTPHVYKWIVNAIGVVVIVRGQYKASQERKKP
jgi:hypothetical protein